MDNPLLTEQYWQKKIAKYSDEDWSKHASLFAEQVNNVVPHDGKLLELGCGYGNDGLFFSEQGFDVLQADLADFRSEEARKIAWQKLDMNNSLPFDHESFDVVYAHLSIHYFTWERTKKLIQEIHDILKPGGYCAFLVNSIHDPEAGTGERIENNFFKIGDINKRFFSVEEARELTTDNFDTTLLDDNATTYKDRKDGLSHLVQFIGRKK